jgi:hypothetical protein
MRAVIMAGATALTLAMAGHASAAELVIRDIVARVVVIPEARADIQVDVQPGRGDAPPVQVSRSGDVVTLSGSARVRSCNFGDGGLWVKINHGPKISIDDAAVVTVRAPRSVRISGGGAVVGSIGRSQDLSLDQDGCANWTAADIAGTLDVSVSNGAHLGAGAVPSARLRADNGGHVRIVSAGSLDAKATNGGHAAAGSVPGAIMAVATDGGLVSIEGGSSRSLSGEAHDGGSIRHKGNAGDVRAEATDGAVIRVEHAGRVLSSYSANAGSVIIDGQPG